jgi:hypothetical protein
MFTIVMEIEGSFNNIKTYTSLISDLVIIILKKDNKYLKLFGLSLFNSIGIIKLNFQKKV